MIPGIAAIAGVDGTSARSTPTKSARVLRTGSFRRLMTAACYASKPMGERARTQGEKTLTGGGSFPYGAWLREVRWAEVALGAALSGALIVGLLGTSAALVGSADAGFTSDMAGTKILFVSPTGFAWKDGVRAGDTILVIVDGEEPADWSMVVRRAQATITTASAIPEGALHRSLPVAIGGIVVGVLAFVLRSLWSGAAWALASVAAMLGSTPLWIQGDATISTAALGAAYVIPAVGLIGPRLRRWWGLAAAGILVAFLVAWSASRAFALGDPTALESSRSTIAFWLTLVVAGLAAVELRGLAGLRLPRRQSSPELLVAAALIGVFAVLGLYFYVPDVVLFSLAAVLLLAYPRSRRALLRAADAAFLGGVKRQAAIEASEGERARLAADLHDVPIQELSAVISRLELLPEAAQEREALRRIAAELRAMTSDLRPPVLDDLGLPMAIESLADQYARDGTALRVEVDDLTLPNRARDPMVELAIYRVTEEAVRNAMTHADAQRVDVTGMIADDRVEIEVRDDGRGLDSGALERARRAGHAGLIAMRHRAEAIGARLSLRSELGAGVSVSLAWQR
jgi:signal transduction histidine kinase